MSGTTNVQRLYRSVVDDVISNVREAFLDEGVDEQVLLELKQLWENKLAQSKAVESGPSANEKLMQTYAQAQKGAITVQPATKKYVPPTILTQLGVGGRIEMSRRYPNMYNTQHHQNVPFREHPPQRRFPFNSYPSCRPPPYQPRSIQPRYHHPPPPLSSQKQAACSYEAGPTSYNHSNTSQNSYNRASCAYSTPSVSSMGASQAAATATVALPQMYQHQLGAGGFTLQGRPDQPTFIIQQSGQVLTTSGMTHIPIQAAIQTGQSTTQGGRVVYTLPIQTTTTTQQAQVQQGVQVLQQLDGPHDSSSDDDDDFDDDDKDDDNDDEQNEEDNEYQGEEEEPLNSEDDISDVDPSELFDADNVVVCQYDKINRCKAKWKFHLKDGIMNLNGKDYVFQKATGDADW